MTMTLRHRATVTTHKAQSIPGSFTFAAAAEAAGSSTTPSATWGATPASGSLLICAIYAGISSTTLTLSGWTALSAETGSGGCSRLFWKIAGSSEPTTVTGASSTTGAWTMLLSSYTTTGTVTYNTDSGQVNGSSTTEATPSLTPPSGQVALIVCTSNAEHAEFWSSEMINGSATGVTMRTSAAETGASSVLYDTIVASTSGSYSGSAATSGSTTGTGHTVIFVAGVNTGGPNPPTVTTGSASSIAQTTATLNGTINPNGTDTTYYFQYGPTTGYGQQTSSADAGSGSSSVPVSASITGLSSSTQYHFRLVATSSGTTYYGADANFFTSTSGGTTPAVATHIYAQQVYDQANPPTSPPSGNDETLAWQYTASTADCFQSDGGAATNATMAALAAEAASLGKNLMIAPYLGNMIIPGAVESDYCDSVHITLPTSQPSWHLVNSSGVQVGISAYPGTFIPDYTNPSWLSYRIAQAKWLHDNRNMTALFYDNTFVACLPVGGGLYNGLFVDASGSWNVATQPVLPSSYGASAGQPYTNVLYSHDLTTFYANLKAGLVAAGYNMTIFNNALSCGMAYYANASTNQAFNYFISNGNTDVIIAEQFMTNGTGGQTCDRSFIQWQQEAQMIKDVEALGGPVPMGWSHQGNYRTTVAQVNAGVLFQFGTYLMGAGAWPRRWFIYYDWKVGLTGEQASIYVCPEHPYLSLAIGDPISTPSQVSWASSSAYCNPTLCTNPLAATNSTSTPNYSGAWGSCYRRDYTNAIILVNPADSDASCIVPLPGGVTWYDATGAIVPSVDLTNTKLATNEYLKNGAIVMNTAP